MNARFAFVVALLCSCSSVGQRADDVELKAPSAVSAGNPLDVSWRGPNRPGDSVQLVPLGTEDGEYYPDLVLSAEAGHGNLHVPAPGEYELRYVQGRGEGVILARAVVRVD